MAKTATEKKAYTFNGYITDVKVIDSVTGQRLLIDCIYTYVGVEQNGNFNTIKIDYNEESADNDLILYVTSVGDGTYTVA